MFVVLVILYVFQAFTNTNAAPFSVVSNIETQQQFCVCSNQRTIWDIIWSCLVTIFSCAWVSVHPNIPGPDDSRIKKALQRLELMFWSIVCPELITYWAARQWFAARRLANRYHGEPHMLNPHLTYTLYFAKYLEYGWMKTHGYFIQMGGFMLYDGDKAVGVLGPRQLEDLHTEGKIAIPLVKEEVIKDHSKGDGLSKALVIVQTTWFLMQCIARRAESPVITQFELVTVTLAALNGIMYYLWWNKPLDVQSNIPVYLLTHKPFDEEVSKSITV